MLAARGRGLVGGTVAASAISVASVPILTRLYGPDAFGAFSYVLVVASAISFLSTGGQEVELLVADERMAGRIVQACYWRIVVASAGVAACSVAIGLLGGLDPTLIVGGLAVLVTISLLRVDTNRLLRAGDLTRVGRTRVVFALTSTSVQIGVGLIAPSALVLLIGVAAGNLLAWILCGPTVHFGPPVRTRSSSWSTGWATAVSNIGVNAPVVVLAASGFGSAAGAYAIATRPIFLLLAALVQPLGQVLASDLGSALRAGEQSGAVLRRSVIATTLVAATIIPILGFAAEFVSEIFGPQWSNLGPMLLAVIPAGFAQLSLSNCAQVLGVTREGRTLMAWEVARTAGGLAVLAGLLRLTEAPALAVLCFGLWTATAYGALFLLATRALGPLGTWRRARIEPPARGA